MSGSPDDDQLLTDAELLVKALTAAQENPAAKQMIGAAMGKAMREAVGQDPATATTIMEALKYAPQADQVKK